MNVACRKKSRLYKLELNDARSLSFKVADTFFLRFIGLMGKKECKIGLWIKPCKSIHMMFMLFPIDAVFLDKDNRIVSIHRNLLPWSFALGGNRANSVLEIPASARATDSLEVGMSLLLSEIF